MRPAPGAEAQVIGLHEPGSETPSDWVVRWAHLLEHGGRVLDLACGTGRHARYLAGRGHRVLACDRDPQALAAIARVEGIETIQADLEDGSAWPFGKSGFAGIVVTNYLHRPLFAAIEDALAPGGVLIYETFLFGNERYGKPSNPRFLLKRDELLEVFGRNLVVAGFEQGRTLRARVAMIQRICAVRGDCLEHDLEPRDGSDSVKILG
jgi:SAM-dependent methyltransferase